MSDEQPVLRLPLDLNDPETENEVADAIRRLAPDGTFVPLSARYPWRFDSRTAGEDLLEQLETLTRALAEQVMHAGPRPGPCPVYLELQVRSVLNDDLIPDRIPCDLRAGHAGMHEQIAHNPSSRSGRWEDLHLRITPEDVRRALAWHEHVAADADDTADDYAAARRLQAALAAAPISVTQEHAP